MKIGILSQWFDPEPGPAALPAIYGREFVRRGHQVRALTGFPNYPTGRIYPGYRMRPVVRERVDDIAVTRVALHPSHDSSAIGRIVNYGSFAASAATLGAGALKGMDALWVYNSPVTVALPLLSHSRWGRIPYFLHVQDLWPDSLIHSGMFPGGAAGRTAAKAVRSIVTSMEKRSAAVGVISPSVRDLILSRHPDLDPSKIIYVPNPTNESLFRPASEIREQFGIAEPNDVEIMYAGAVGEVQGLDTLLDAARSVVADERIRITIVGDGISRERLERRVADEDISNVRFLGRVSQDAIPELMAKAQAQLVSLAPTPFLNHTTPSKIATLLASELPIVGHLAGDGAALIRESGAGPVVDPGDADGLAQAFLDLADGGGPLWRRLGAAGRRYYDQNLSARSAADRILGALFIDENMHGSQQAEARE